MWKKKTVNQRFSDTYAFIRQQLASAPELDAALALLDLRVEALDDAGQMVPLLELMSLGHRWEITHSPVETRRRHYVRAVLLGRAALGDPDQGGRLLSVAEVKAGKGATEKLTEQQLHALLVRMVKQGIETAGTRTFVGFDTSLEKENAVWALDRIAEAVTKVQWTLGMLTRSTDDQERFRKWFGAGDAKATRANFAKIYSGIQAGVILIKDDDASKDKVFGYVYPDGPNDPPRIYLCGAFWRAGRLSWRGRSMLRKDGRDGHDNPLGVLLHELSHIFVHTQDHRYGQGPCEKLAERHPELAGMNADNYEYYAEAVMGAQ